MPMLIPFECSISNISRMKSLVGNINKITGKTTSRRIPHEIDASNNEFYQGLLRKCELENGIIDGSDLQTLNFPFDEEEYNIFISYSHNDENEAVFLYQWFTSHGLTCFLDSTIWHCADKLLKNIDNRYCLAADLAHYDYVKRNFSTSHVHAMLSMAILEAIDRSECCLFIKSNNSVLLKEGIETKTLSPWIYEENLLMDKIRRKEPSRFHSKGIRKFSNGGKLIVEDASENLGISYDLQCEFKPITGDELFSLKSVEALDILYEKKGIVSRNKLHG